jgi:imidazolonepropionase-like amidohydrolase
VRWVKALAVGFLVLLASFLVFLAIGLLWPITAAPVESTKTAIVIAGAHIADVASGSTKERLNVVVEGGRVVAVGPAAEIVSPTGSQVVDGSGRYLIPGLWDMHVHLAMRRSPELHLPLFIAYGVTAVRDMMDCKRPGDPFEACVEDKREWNKRILEGSLVGPRIVSIASFAVDGPGGRVKGLPDFIGPENAEQARELARFLKERRVDAVKVYNNLPREAYFALVEEAKRLGLEVVGHRPRAISVDEASRAGQRSIEHARDFLADCYPGAEALRNRPANAPRWKPTVELREMVDLHQAAKCEGLFSTLAAQGTWICPTHITRKMDAYADDPAYRADPRLEFLPWMQRFVWKQDADGMVARDPSAESRRAYLDFYRAGLALTAKAHARGVKILAGTDANDTYAFPGSGLHDELEELVRAGLSPADALRASVVRGPEYFGLSQDYGAVEVGKVADLVLLDGNPLEDIRNTRRISAVVFNGNLYRRADLDRLLDYVRSQAGSLSLSIKIGWALARSLI